MLPSLQFRKHTNIEPANKQVAHQRKLPKPVPIIRNHMHRIPAHTAHFPTQFLAKVIRQRALNRILPHPSNPSHMKELPKLLHAIRQPFNQRPAPGSALRAQPARSDEPGSAPAPGSGAPFRARPPGRGKRADRLVWSEREVVQGRPLVAEGNRALARRFVQDFLAQLSQGLPDLCDLLHVPALQPRRHGQTKEHAGAADRVVQGIPLDPIGVQPEGIARLLDLPLCAVAVAPVREHASQDRIANGVTHCTLPTRYRAPAPAYTARRNPSRFVPKDIHAPCPCATKPQVCAAPPLAPLRCKLCTGEVAAPLRQRAAKCSSGRTLPPLPSRRQSGSPALPRKAFAPQSGTPLASRARVVRAHARAHAHARARCKPNTHWGAK